MKIITFGEIVDAGQSVFHSVLSVDGRSLKHRFEGVIRVDNPYRSLKDHIDEIPKKVEGLAIDEVLIDFAELRFCNSNGFYVIMDIVEAIYTSASDAKVTVRRLDDEVVADRQLDVAGVRKDQITGSDLRTCHRHTVIDLVVGGAV